MKRGATVAERIAGHVEKDENGCWIWAGWTNAAGYGLLKINGKSASAHRASYAAHVGPIPEGLHLDHLCHTFATDCAGGVDCHHRRCVNPAHLEPVTPTENVIRSGAPAAVNLRKTECNRGHELSGANLKVEADGHRRCRECRRIQDANRWPRRKVQRQAARSAA